jgi:hypothetical protein
MSRYDPIRDEFIAATTGGLNPNIPALSQSDRLDALLDRQKAFDDDYRADREEALPATETLSKTTMTTTSTTKAFLLVLCFLRKTCFLRTA